jgi:PrtD family type I secretion system ABC transporter
MEKQRSPVTAALRSSRKAFLAVAALSGMINILMLTGSVFMIQIYDRVLVSRSLPTLAALSAIAIAAYLFQGMLDIIRGRVLALVGERVDAAVGPALHRAVIEMPLRPRRWEGDAPHPFRDLDAIRGFLAGNGPAALFDLPWLPVYLLLCYVLHPLLGYAAILAAVVLLCIAVLTEIAGGAPTRGALEAQSRRNALADHAQRSAEAVLAMGMMPALAERWSGAQLQHLKAQRRASFIIGGLAACARMIRMIVQSAMLGLGAYLAIKAEISGGSIIAASILTARALSPVDQALANWRGFVAARHGYRRLRQFLFAEDAEQAFQLRPPEKSLAADNLFVGAPGADKPIIRRIAFRIQAGQTLGIIGPSASGKSTLARGLAGVWLPLAGKVMIDDADLRHWSPHRLGPHIGYLPQDVQLFDGTIAENISRFRQPIDSPAVLEAAQAAGFHEQILGLPDGYETRIGQGGIALSAGQRQRLGLARALYGKPFLVILDEPNSNLDADGERALRAAIAEIGRRGGIAVVVAHRASLIGALDLIAVMANGEMTAFGPRDAILKPKAASGERMTIRQSRHSDALMLVQGEKAEG